MEDWWGLKVNGLHAELCRRGLSTEGVKRELVERLVGDDALKAAASVSLAGAEASTEAGPSFAPQDSASSANAESGNHRAPQAAEAQTTVPDQLYIPAACLVHRRDQRQEMLRGYQDLIQNQWIRVEEVAIQDNDNCVVRVYVLPDDVENARIDRTSLVLRRQRKELFAAVDFSTDTWNGVPDRDVPSKFPTLSPAARAFLGDEDGADIPLLTMFNSIPAPKPDIDMIDDKHDRNVMAELLSSTVRGLTTDMYPHQRRAAALMHQKEVSPAQFLDTRLVEVLDQSGGVYYYDSVTGNTFREGRYYDGIRGGILAEQMGAGKTLICLALVAATRDESARVPDIYQGSNITVRPRVGSLLDIAAAVATKYANPWKRSIPAWRKVKLDALDRNPGWYYLPYPESRRPARGRKAQICRPPRKIYLSHTTLIVVPANLLQQWLEEIRKHTEGLKVHTIKLHSDIMLDETELLRYDIVIVASETMSSLWTVFRANRKRTFACSLGGIRFKRCIVDEGHTLGHDRLSGIKTALMCALDALQCDARWIATGTPAHGLFGVEEGGEQTTNVAVSTATQERVDLGRIGGIARNYLRARPWSNTIHDYGDTVASWNVYVMQPRHNRESGGRADCLRSIFNSMLIRHPLSEVSCVLPTVDARVVELEGSYQDKLSLNTFAMMIISNAVQSQRTDQDYFFHRNNRKALLELVANLRQASFYGGAFFSYSDIVKAVERAEEFIEKEDIAISGQDRTLIHAAIAHGRLAIRNSIIRYQSHPQEPPMYVKDFPTTPPVVGECDWAIDGKHEAGLICTHWAFMVAAQKSIHPSLFAPECRKEFNAYMESRFLLPASQTRCFPLPSRIMIKYLNSQSPSFKPPADNAHLGTDHVRPRKGHVTPINAQSCKDTIPTPPKSSEAATLEIPPLLAKAQLVSTCSAKLSYLIDAISMYQKDEQMIVFYDNSNIAWYLAGVLEMLSIHHLIYARGLTAARQSQYVTTFNNTGKFRVLLMDINQAAFGLDMRAASRIYFISPVLNPQVEAQAIARVCRISQQKRVTVETLVLKDSLEEVMVQRKRHMTHADHRRCETILDDGPIYNWILNAKITPMPDVDVDDGPAQMAPLKVPQYIFGLGLGRERSSPDEDILLGAPSSEAAGKSAAAASSDGPSVTKKRVQFADDDKSDEASDGPSMAHPAPSASSVVKRARSA